jgi:hypothetical protein
MMCMAASQRMDNTASLRMDNTDICLDLIGLRRTELSLNSNDLCLIYLSNSTIKLVGYFYLIH